MTHPIVNLADLALQTRPPQFMPPPAVAERIEAHTGRIKPLLGLRALGCGLMVAVPGKPGCPFQSHRSNAAP